MKTTSGRTASPSVRKKCRDCGALSAPVWLTVEMLGGRLIDLCGQCYRREIEPEKA